MRRQVDAPHTVVFSFRRARVYGVFILLFTAECAPKVDAL
jgi:hypothetical protein